MSTDRHKCPWPNGTHVRLVLDRLPDQARDRAGLVPRLDGEDERALLVMLVRSVSGGAVIERERLRVVTFGFVDDAQLVGACIPSRGVYPPKALATPLGGTCFLYM